MAAPHRGTSPHSPVSGESSHSAQASEGSSYGPHTSEPQVSTNSKSERRGGRKGANRKRETKRPEKNGSQTLTETFFFFSHKHTATRRRTSTRTVSSLCSIATNPVLSTPPSMIHTPLPTLCAAIPCTTLVLPSSRMAPTRNPPVD